MSKYHIVYQKMETVLSNWANAMKYKSEKERLRKAFNMMRLRVQVQKQA